VLVGTTPLRIELYLQVEASSLETLAMDVSGKF
jgi:hypothetical protein